MKKHALKTDPEVFDAVAAGLKTFEIRKDDRGYEVGDILYLERTRFTGAEMSDGKPLEYTGEKAVVEVSHILRGPLYGLQENWVILSFKATSMTVNVLDFRSAEPIKPPKLRRDWIGKKVRLRKELRTSLLVIQADTVCTVKYAHRGAELITDPCACCGVRVHIRKAGWDDLEFLGKGGPEA